MLTVACVLKTGGVYDATWVARLKAGVAKHLPERHRFVALSDADVPCERVWMSDLWPGWFAKIGLFRLPGPLVYFDLDSLVIGDLTDIAAAVHEHEFIALRDFYRPGGLGSGVMGWRGDVSFLRAAFADRAEAFMERHRYGGDQAYLEEALDLADVTRWQDIAPDQIVSFKAHNCIAGPPLNARVVALHGRPKFTDMAPGSWARAAWETAA